MWLPLCIVKCWVSPLEPEGGSPQPAIMEDGRRPMRARISKVFGDFIMWLMIGDFGVVLHVRELHQDFIK